MKKNEKLIDIKTFKFILVGLVNTLVGSGIMFTLYNVFHVSYWLSSASNYVVGSLVSYLLNKTWTFQNQEKAKTTLPRFIVNIVICYILAYGIAKPFVGFILSGQSTKLQDNLSMGVGLVLFTGFNYLGQRYFVFREKTSKEQETK